MKIDRHGKAKVLSQEEIQLLFNEGLTTLRDRCLFGICLFTACRINEACTLRRTDVFDKKRNVRPELIIRKGNTKGKLVQRGINNPPAKKVKTNGKLRVNQIIGS
jgi:integrase/recombinase XerD